MLFLKTSCCVCTPPQNPAAPEPSPVERPHGTALVKNPSFLESSQLRPQTLHNRQRSHHWVVSDLYYIYIILTYIIHEHNQMIIVLYCEVWGGLL